jgi:hypothetical protein
MSLTAKKMMGLSKQRLKYHAKPGEESEIFRKLGIYVQFNMPLSLGYSG